MIKTENKVIAEKANNYANAHKVTDSAWDQTNNEMTNAFSHQSLEIFHVTDTQDLVVNTDLKGQPGDVVMWVDDACNKRINKFTPSIRPYVLGKVEEVITKL